MQALNLFSIFIILCNCTSHLYLDYLLSLPLSGEIAHISFADLSSPILKRCDSHLHIICYLSKRWYVTSSEASYNSLIFLRFQTPFFLKEPKLRLRSLRSNLSSRLDDVFLSVQVSDEFVKVGVIGVSHTILIFVLRTIRLLLILFKNQYNQNLQSKYNCYLTFISHNDSRNDNLIKIIIEH